MRRWILFGMLLLSVAALPAQQDPHQGQPASCTNARGSAHPCACARAMTCPEPGQAMDESKCQVYCRPDHCHCVGPCDD